MYRQEMMGKIMATINKNIVMKSAKMLLDTDKQGSPVDHMKQEISAHGFDDIQVLFAKSQNKKIFYSLYFTYAGSAFVIDNKCQAFYYKKENQEEYSIDNDKVIENLEQYLTLRCDWISHS